MQKALCFSLSLLVLLALVSVPDQALAKRKRAPQNGLINSRSAILVDMGDGRILYEQDPDASIAPASITKVLTLYIVFEALREGRLKPWENVTVSSRAAMTGGSRMGLKTGHIVPVEELIKGMAVVSGNDACVAVAEHMAGSVEDFVRIMNHKARELGMTHSRFSTPNGLPAPGQYTTARDIAKLSVAYLRRFPESLSIHSMQSYTYRTTTHRNANRLLATCPGVDGLKTGFVCAAGYNLSATCRRGETRLLAVVLGAPSAAVRAAETAKLIELGYHAIASGSPVIRVEDTTRLASSGAPAASRMEQRAAETRPDAKRLTVAATNRSRADKPERRRGAAASQSRSSSTTKRQIAAGTCAPTRPSVNVATSARRAGTKEQAMAKITPTTRAQVPASKAAAPVSKPSAEKKLAVAGSSNAARSTAKKPEPSPAIRDPKSRKRSAQAKDIIQGSDKPPTVSTAKQAKRGTTRQAESAAVSKAAVKKKSGS